MTLDFGRSEGQTSKSYFNPATAVTQWSGRSNTRHLTDIGSRTGTRVFEVEDQVAQEADRTSWRSNPEREVFAPTKLARLALTQRAMLAHTALKLPESDKDWPDLE